MGTPSANRPPLARWAREFLTGVQLPPAPKRGPNPNKDRALVLNAMVWHARHVQEKAESVTCNPSLEQIAQLTHCSPRSVQRVIQDLTSLGIVSSQRRGDGLSSVYTIHRRPKSATTTVVHSETEFRHDKLASQTGQLGRSDMTTRSSDTTTPVSDATTVVHLRGNSSGVGLQGRSPSGVDLQGGIAEAKSKPAPCSSSLKNQEQDGYYFASSLKMELQCNGFDLAWSDHMEQRALKFFRAVITAESTKSGTSLKQAFESIRERTLQDRRQGIAIDQAYFERIGQNTWEPGIGQEELQ